MRIRRVKWKDHPVLGSLDLDFINPPRGNPFEQSFLQARTERANLQFSKISVHF